MLLNIDYIAWWGAGLSTLLALVKIWEVWRDRFRIEVGYGFSGEPGIGNDIYIRNLSGKPIILTHWEVFFRPNLWPIKKDTHISSPGEFAHDKIITPHSSMKLNFSDMDHFNWGWKVMKGRRIYIKLYIAGRRSLLKKVYG